MELLKNANGNIPRTFKEKQIMIKAAAKHYAKFLTALGFDYQVDENSRNTPTRVAKAWVEDIIAGTNSQEPKITQFPNSGYEGIVFQGNIEVTSLCSHHNLLFDGKAHIAYIPKKDGKVVGLSKLNRIVDFYARRPQIQEGLTQQIADHINKVIDNEGVAITIEAGHSCVACRGIKHDSTMKTAVVTGHFAKNEAGCKDEFYQMVSNLKK